MGQISLQHDTSEKFDKTEFTLCVNEACSAAVRPPISASTAKRHARACAFRFPSPREWRQKGADMNVPRSCRPQGRVLSTKLRHNRWPCRHAKQRRRYLGVLRDSLEMLRSVRRNTRESRSVAISNSGWAPPLGAAGSSDRQTCGTRCLKNIYSVH
jgi:hypothetical protein